MKQKMYIFLATLVGVFTQVHSSLANGVFGTLFDSEKQKNPYCGDGECGLEKGIKTVGEAKIQGVITGDATTSKTLFEYIQDVVSYLLMFVSVIGVLYIIYSGFTVLTAGGDEEKVKDTKKTITYVAIGMAIMWLAYAIVQFIVKALNASNAATSFLYL